MDTTKTLREWLRQERGRATRMANELNINYSFLMQIASGKKRALLDTAIRIEAYTNQEVSIETLNATYLQAEK